MHKQNDVVAYVENGVATNALVVSSNALADVHAGQAANKDTPVVEHLTLVMVSSNTQGVQNLTPISHGIFLRTIFGARPLANAKATGWREVDVIPHGSGDLGIGLVEDYTLADLPELLGKKVLVDLGATQFKEGTVTNPQPEASADVPPSIHVDFDDSSLWISPDMIIAVLDASGHLVGAGADPASKDAPPVAKSTQQSPDQVVPGAETEAPVTLATDTQQVPAEPAAPVTAAAPAATA